MNYRTHYWIKSPLLVLPPLLMEQEYPFWDACLADQAQLPMAQVTQPMDYSNLRTNLNSMLVLMLVRSNLKMHSNCLTAKAFQTAQHSHLVPPEPAQDSLDLPLLHQLPLPMALPSEPVSVLKMFRIPS